MAARIHTWSGPCPHCGHDVEFALSFGEFNFRAKDTGQAWLEQQCDGIKELVALAESTGILSAFVAALKQARPVLPRNPPKFFLEFLGRMVEMKSPRILLLIGQELGSGQYEVYSADEIAAIFRNGQLLMFVPLAHLKASKVAANAITTKITVREWSDVAGKFSGWVKTRMGYVPDSARTFMQEMRKRSPGQFATVKGL